MTASDAVAAVLHNADHIEEAARKLLPLLLKDESSDQEIRDAGFDPAIVRIAQRKTGDDLGGLLTACVAGVAMEQGRRSVDRQETWEPVITAPFESARAHGVRRGTAETVVSLIRNAEANIRMVAPFIEAVGLGYLSEPLVMATKRGVATRICAPDQSTDKSPFKALKEKVEKEGAPELLRIQRVEEGHPWPHLKVVVSDSAAAYVGSANFTRPALTGDNLELGILVKGDAVSSIVRVFDSIPVSGAE